MLAREFKHSVLASLFAPVAFSAPASAQDHPAAAALPSVAIEHFLPVKSRAMQPGPVDAERRPTGVSRPFFLVGTDAYSLDWLAKNRERLVKLQAFGLVVEVRDATAYRRLEALAQGLVVRPVSADLIAEHLSLKRYPALITAEGVFP